MTTTLCQMMRLRLPHYLNPLRKVIHVIARQLIDHTDILGELHVKSRDFR